MIRFLIDNPTLTACGIICIWPMILSGTAFWLGRKVGIRGGLPRLVWKDEEI